MPPMVTEEAIAGTWRLLDLSYSSVFENLALEEALARTTQSANFEPTVRFWVDPASVVLGRFQRTSDEVDTTLCEQYGVQIARRFTGGGAVFHDEGNLNFTIVNRGNGTLSPTKLHEADSSIVVDALSELGMKATFFSPNSIIVGSRKVSGAAAALGSGFTLWHNSILVSSNVDILERVLAPSRKINSTPFVRSRWCPVSTLETVLGKRIGLKRVKSQLVTSLLSILGGKVKAGRLNADEEATFRSLFDGKYSSLDWNQDGNWKEI